EGDFRVDAADSIRSNDAAIVGACGVWNGIQLAIGVDKTDGGLLANVAVHANDIEIGAMIMQWVRGIDAAARRLIVREERPDGPGPALGRQSQTVLRVSNATSGDKIDRRVEVTAVLEEKCALLRKENFEAVVDRGLRV